MKKILSFALIVISFAGCAQVSHGIVKARGYYFLVTPGNIAVDDNGNPMSEQHTEYRIFLEVTGKQPEWTKACTIEQSFSVASHMIKEKSVLIGKRKAGGLQITMQAEKANTLFQLELMPAEKQQTSPQTLKEGELLLEGKWKGKTVYYKIPALTEITSPQYQ